LDLTLYSTNWRNYARTFKHTYKSKPRDMKRTINARGMYKGFEAIDRKLLDHNKKFEALIRRVNSIDGRIMAIKAG